MLALAAPALAADGRTLEERCEAEIVELHRFLEEWSNAELPDTDEAFRRFGDVIASSFVIIDPDGEVIEREPIVEAIRRAHGRWREEPGEIRIESFRLHQQGEGYALATYEEWHELSGKRIGRLSSVLFGVVPDLPNGVEWLHLHEVWIPLAALPLGATGPLLPRAIQIGQPAEALRSLLEEDCERTEELHYTGEMAAPFTAQTQINCFGLAILGAERDVELMFNDGPLGHVWIHIRADEIEAITRALAEEFGPVVFASGLDRVFERGTVAVRSEPPEVLVATPELIRELTGL